MKTLIAALTGLLLLNTACAFPQAGSLDSSFGIDGKVIKPKGFTRPYEHSMALQPDGKILIAGSMPGGESGDFFLVRYKPDGTIDKKFGSDGKVITDFGVNAYAAAVAVQANGKIVVGGDDALARYNPDGSLDSSFGTNGKVSTYYYDSTVDGSGGEVNSLAIQADGKIVTTGTVDQVFYGSGFGLARYETDGSPDSSFGENGRVRTFISGDSHPYSVAIQPDGKIVVAGQEFDGIGLIRYKPDGNFDSSFGFGGIVGTYAGGAGGWCDAYSIAIQADKKIVVAGAIYGEPSEYNVDFIVLRYQPNGSLDNSFGNDGYVFTNFNNNFDYANSVVLQPDGKIVVAGYSHKMWDFPNDFAIARYTKKGRRDKTFGINGKVITDLGGDDNGYAAALQTDGKLIVAGSSGNKFALVRYKGDAVSIATFASDRNSNMVSDHSTVVKIYPNPVQSVLNIQFNNNASAKTINIYDVNGKLLITKSAPGNTQLDMRQLTGGVYLMQINDKSGKILYNGKVIKQQ